MQYAKYFLFTFVIILLDQAIKMLVHFNLPFNEGIPIFGNLQLFKLHYITNPGMAFGMEIGGRYGKVILSVFRLFAMVGIGYYLLHLAKKNAPVGLLWCIAAILGGAIGNVIDSTFYGVLPFIDNAPIDSPTKWFHGQVIDMAYIDIWEGYFPEWMPVFGGQYMSFWPIFNFADASIFISVCVILLNQKKFFKELENTVSGPAEVLKDTSSQEEHSI